jgi:hypothetical protein
VDNPHAAALHVPLPDEPEMQAYIRALATTSVSRSEAKSEVPIATLGARLTGLSRVGARTAISLASATGSRSRRRGSARSRRTSSSANARGCSSSSSRPSRWTTWPGTTPVKAWLREDTALLRRGAVRALPMGYLIAGRIGTGKTFIVQCWAGEIGIPCVVFKNFRDRWVGATESNLEKIFAVLRAVGQVVVFVDEADQAAGRAAGATATAACRGASTRCWPRRCPTRATAAASSGCSPRRGPTCSKST